MLVLFNQFILKSAVRSPIYLLNPVVVDSTEISLPRLSVLHYLDTQYDNHFPTRDMPYFSIIPKNKKIPIYHITDLISKEETTTLLNKYVQRDIRKWYISNIKTFKNVDLLESPNKDINVISIYNYNLLKDLYKYKTSLLSKYYQYKNLYSTYYYYIKEALKADTESHHFISINLPNGIPNYNIINIILKFNELKYSRVVTDDNLKQVIDLYLWLLNETRNRSNLKDITDEDSNRVMIEFKYRGYSCFTPLYVIRSLCKESSLESNIKISDKKIQRLFILFLYKIQDKVNTILEQNEKEVTKDTLVEDDADKVKEEILNDSDKNNLTDDSDPLDKIPEYPGITKTKVSENKIDDKFLLKDLNVNQILETDSFNTLLDSSLNELEASTVNDIYEESILKVQEENNTTDDQQSLQVDTSEEHIENLLKEKNLDTEYEKFIKEVTEFKLLTPTELRSIRKIYENRANLTSPYDKDKQIDEYKQLNSNDTVITKEDVKLDIDNILIKDTFKEDAVLNFDKKYLKTTLKKDIVACVTNLEKSGIVIKEYNIEEDISSLGNYEIHQLTLKPLNGKESTIYFRLPKIDSEGEFVVSGIKVRMRKQRTDLPIRKIAYNKVALTSNYSKLFVFRTERKAFDSYNYIVEYIKNSYLDENGIVTKLLPGNTYNNYLSLPNTYSYLSQHFKEVQTKDYTFIFNYNEISNYIDKETLEDLNKKQLIFIGYNKAKEILVIDDSEIIKNYSNNLAELGTIDQLLDIDSDKLPKSFTAIKILGDDLPLGIMLSYYLGISGLLSITKAKYELIESNKQYKPTKNQVVIKFNDYKLIVNTTKETELLFNGFFYFKDFIKQYSIYNFDLKDIYLNLIEERDFSLIHIKEMNLLEQLFLDPITIDVLKSMQEPTTFIRLLLRANELLKDFSYPDPNDPNYSRIRGYDRVPGLLYKALSEAIRDYKFKNTTKAKIELDPYKVWNAVTRDNTVKISEDTNPILEAKEIETVTLSGADGLDKDAVPKALRRYHKNDIGLISESTVDSGDVGLNIYLTPYAKIKDVRGTVHTDSSEFQNNKAKIFSTSALLAPFSDHDDMKRINFVSIQNGHTIASVGYQQPLIRTGYEYIMPYRVGKLYCSIAKQDGQVIEKTDKLLTVKYNDNSIESFPLGTEYGRMEGTVYPHNLITELKLNDKFKKNDYLTYNASFFEKDWLDPSKLILKMNRTVTTALTLNNEVYSDSSAISPELSKIMSTTVIKERSFIIEFNKNITNLLPENTKVTPNDVLFVVLDETTDYNNLSESTIEMLQSLAALAPKAKVNGTIERYEIKYNGDIQDMSPTLRKLATKLDKDIYERTKGTEYEVTSNKVTSEYRVEGKNLNVDTLELKVYISVDVTQAIGDKGIFANQMKSVISDIFTSDIYTESGLKIDAMFSFASIMDRVVTSPLTMGTTLRILKAVSKQASDIYFK